MGSGREKEISQILVGQRIQFQIWGNQGEKADSFKGAQETFKGRVGGLKVTAGEWHNWRAEMRNNNPKHWPWKQSWRCVVILSCPFPLQVTGDCTAYEGKFPLKETCLKLPAIAAACGLERLCLSSTSTKPSFTFGMAAKPSHIPRM